MKFQGVVTPDGLFAHLDGPYRAPQNDSGVLNESRLLAHIEKNTIQPGSNEGDPPSHHFYQLYGDSAYGVGPYIVNPYAGTDALTPQQGQWNVAMGGVHILVMHGFGLVFQDWPCWNMVHMWSTLMSTPCPPADRQESTSLSTSCHSHS